MEVSRFCLRAGVTGVLWFYGRNMIMARVWSLIKWATQVKSEGRQHAQIGIARSRSGLLPASPISISILDASFTRTCSTARPSFVLTQQTYCVFESILRVVLGTRREVFVWV